MSSRLALYICLIFFTQKIVSQNETYHMFGGGYNEGINVNAGSDRQFGITKPCGAELFWSRKKAGEKQWERLYNFPKVGWKLNWYDHRNALLGNSYAISRTIDITILNFKHSEFTFRAAQGIMYATKQYDSKSATPGRYNNALGQAINFSEELGLGFSVFVNKNVSLNFNTLITHYSSGAIAQPNDGLNLLSFQGGLCYRYGYKKNAAEKDTAIHTIDKRIKFNASIGSGINQLNASNTRKYPLFTGMLYADKQLNHVSKLNVGIDVYMNTATKHEIDNDVNYKGTDFKRVGVAAGHELLIDKLGIVLQAGYQFYSPYPALHKYYQKFGLKYYMNKHVFAVVMLRGYKFGVSDELSWGVGVRL